jgi:hypothetical protein
METGTLQDPLDEYLELPNPKKPSTTRNELFQEISNLSGEQVKPNKIWPHSCRFEDVENSNSLDDPPGYIREDDFYYDDDKNKINWKARIIEEQRFENAHNFLEKIKLINKGKSEKDLYKHLRESVHPNKFGTQMNLEAEVLKRSDWTGKLRLRWAKIYRNFICFYDNKSSQNLRCTINIKGCVFKGYDWQAANKNSACDLYGLGLTEEQAKCTIGIFPPDRMRFFIILPTYEERTEWLYSLKRKSEVGDNYKPTKTIKGIIGEFASDTIKNIRSLVKGTADSAVDTTFKKVF